MTAHDTTIAAPAAPAASRRTAANPPRVDLYAAVHKALRLFMGDTLARVGRLDPDDAGELSATLAQVEALLAQCRSHVDKENRYVHTAIEARRAGASGDIAAEHAEHLEAIAGLEAEVIALRALPTAAGAFRLYRRLARFVADNLVHMDVEETVLNAALWADHTDAELTAVEHRILASIDPAEMARVLRWMVPALSPAERAGMLSAMPPAARDGALSVARPHLDDRAWAKLTRALGLPPAPGLVTV